jgi:hypothetical protein
LAFWVLAVIASVPVVVTGEPDTDKSLGTVIATLVTVPEPPPGQPPPPTVHTPPDESWVMASAVDTPVPRPLTPVPIGNPVRFVAVPLLGVPSAPLKVTKAPALPTFTPSAVPTPVPRPVTFPSGTVQVFEPQLIVLLVIVCVPASVATTVVSTVIGAVPVEPVVVRSPAPRLAVEALV